MPENAPTSIETRRYDVEENYPRTLSEWEVERLRGQATSEVWRIISNTVEEDNRPVDAFDDIEESPPASPEPPRYPFGTPVIETEKETWEEACERERQMIRQLEVGLRHIDELIAIDTQICGSPETGTSGIRLPVLRIGQRGKRHAVITTKNSWGSTPLEEDPEAEEHLKKQCMREGPSGPELDQAKYQRLKTGYEREAAKNDLPVLGEDDRVDIFDEQDNHIGSGIVREAVGNTVRLHLHSAARQLKPGCYIKKRSNRNTLETYREYTRGYCAALRCENLMMNSDGEPYWPNGTTYRPKKKGGMELTRERYDGMTYGYAGAEYRDAHESYGMYQTERFSLPENVFFGEEWNDYTRDTLRETANHSYLNDEDIPLEIVGDDEQCSAFALGAMGYPCYLIQGPPGTGKTTVASLLAKYFQERGKKTLILSHSNRGLDVLLHAAQKKGVRVHRGGSEESACDRRLKNTFIRKGLKHPKRVEFSVPVPDPAAFQAAQAAYDPQSGDPAPRQENFVTMELDKQAWHEAWDKFERKKQEIIDELRLDGGLVAGVTLNSLITDEIIQALDFDVVIVDEASKGYIYEILPALKKAGKQIIFIGDHMQLGNIDIPPQIKHALADRQKIPAAADTVDAPEENPDAEDPYSFDVRPEDIDHFEGGVFKFMEEHGKGVPRVMLRTNRRSRKNLVRAVSHGVYGGKLKAGRRDEDDPTNEGRLVWVDISNRPDKGDKSSGVSKEHPLEATLLARRLMRDFERGELTPDNFGVIAMYNGQRRLIWRKARRVKPKNEGTDRQAFHDFLRPNLDSVDGFQGSERDRVYLSPTRSNEEEHIGHLKDPRRLNVGASRARDELFIVGDRRTLIDENPDPESRAFFEVLYGVCETYGEIIDTFPELPESVRPEEEKVQTRNARRKRKQRAQRRAMKEAGGECG